MQQVAGHSQGMTVLVARRVDDKMNASFPFAPPFDPDAPVVDPVNGTFGKLSAESQSRLGQQPLRFQRGTRGGGGFDLVGLVEQLGIHRSQTMKLRQHTSHDRGGIGTVQFGK